MNARLSRHGRARLRAATRWRELTGSASTAVIAFGLLACICSFLAVAGPRAGADLRTHAFRQLVAQTPAADKTIVGSVYDATLGDSPTGLAAGQLVKAKNQIRRNLAGLPLAPARTDWTSLTTPFIGAVDQAPPVRTGASPQLELSYRDTLARYVRVVAGKLPAGQPGSGATATLQAAVTVATAHRFGLVVGSRVPLPASQIVLRITAIVEPLQPAAPFWTVDPVVTTPEIVQPVNGVPYWQGGAFIASSGVIALQSRVDTTEIQITWTFPVSLGGLTGSSAEALQQTLSRTLQTAGRITVGGVTTGGFGAGGLGAGGSGGPIPIGLTSGVSTLLASFAAADAAVGSVLAMLSVSLAIVAASVVLLAAWLLVNARRPDLAVLRARGASCRQLAFVVLRSSAIAVVPGVAAGVAVALIVTPDASAAMSWWLAGLMLLTTLAGPALIAARAFRGYTGAEGRADQQAGPMSSTRRLIVEAGLVLASVGGLIVLRDQGTGPGGGDVYATAAPILVAIPVAIVMVRIYPVLVRGLLRLAGQRPGVTAFLGLARAGRVSLSAALPAFAMVLALGLVSFAGMVRGAVIRGEVTASWQQAGADAVISVPGTISQAQQRAVAALPGVQRVAAVSITTASLGSGTQLTLALVDPVQYSALLAATPLPQPNPAFVAGEAAAAGVGKPVLAMASPSLASQFGSRLVSVLAGPDAQPLRLQFAGQAADMSAFAGLGGSPAGYLVLPRSALGGSAPAPNTLLVVGPGLNRVQLAALVQRAWPGATIVFRSRLLAALRAAPLQNDAYLALALGGYTAAVACMLVLLLTLMLSAQSRRLTLARMNTMGLTAAQGRRMAMAEALPQFVAVLIGGVASAIALAPLIGPALSLAVFTGSSASVPVLIEPAWLSATAAGLLVLAILILTGQALLASRSTARFLRIGG